MDPKEALHYKALYFDLGVNALKENYSETNPQGAYKRIKEFLREHDFLHEQYSGYHSKYRTTDMDVVELIDQMNSALPWLAPCVNRFEVTDIGENHDLKHLFDREEEIFS